MEDGSRIAFSGHTIPGLTNIILRRTKLFAYSLTKKIVMFQKCHAIFVDSQEFPFAKIARIVPLECDSNLPTMWRHLLVQERTFISDTPITCAVSSNPDANDICPLDR